MDVVQAARELLRLVLSSRSTLVLARAIRQQVSDWRRGHHRGGVPRKSSHGLEYNSDRARPASGVPRGAGGPAGRGHLTYFARTNSKRQISLRPRFPVESRREHESSLLRAVRGAPLLREGTQLLPRVSLRLRRDARLSVSLSTATGPHTSGACMARAHRISRGGRCGTRRLGGGGVPQALPARSLRHHRTRPRRAWSRQAAESCRASSPTGQHAGRVGSTGPKFRDVLAAVGDRRDALVA